MGSGKGSTASRGPGEKAGAFPFYEAVCEDRMQYAYPVEERWEDILGRHGPVNVWTGRMLPGLDEVWKSKAHVSSACLAQNAMKI